MTEEQRKILREMAQQGQVDGLHDLGPNDLIYGKMMEQLAKVKKLHSKETRYTVYGFEERSWESMDDLAEWFGEDDLPNSTEISTFDVCKSCAEDEWLNSDFSYIGERSAWPCRTARIWEVP